MCAATVRSASVVDSEMENVSLLSLSLSVVIGMRMVAGPIAPRGTSHRPTAR